VAAPAPVVRPSRSLLARLPWGVFGVGAVIVGLGLGAVLLLRDAGSNPPARPTGTSQVASAPLTRTTATLAYVATLTPTLGQTGPTGTPTEAALPTTTPTPAPTTPTDTPAPPQPVEYEVQSGDTCGGIASKYGVSLSEFLSLNNLEEDPCLIRVGDKVLIPQPTPTAGPAPTLEPGATQEPTTLSEATATLPPQIIYQVRGGDTCSEIAEKYRMTVDTLIVQNGLDTNCTLQIGQVLTLTFATPTPGVSPTPIVAQTPTPQVGYNAPLLSAPLDGAQISNTQDVVTLLWLSVGLLKDDEWYVVQVQPSGAMTVPVFETKATSIKITQDIFGSVNEQEFAWWVQVKQLVGVNDRTGERIYNVVSPPSLVRHFVWRKPVGTPTPVPTPTQ
jgi:LysM repeat protein